MEKGKCSNDNHIDPDLWFPEKGDPDYKDKVKWAKRICGSCPVMQTCLTYAVDNDISDGIWGGLTKRERNAHVKKQERSGEANPMDPEMARPIDMTNATRGFITKKGRAVAR